MERAPSAWSSRSATYAERPRVLLLTPSSSMAFPEEDFEQGLIRDVPRMGHHLELVDPSRLNWVRETKLRSVFDRDGFVAIRYSCFFTYADTDPDRWDKHSDLFIKMNGSR